MNKQLPDIGIYLAEQALKEYYRPRRQIIQLEEIEEFCRQEASLNLYRTYLRLQRQHIDRIVVGMVLANLAEDEQKFVQYHYRDNMGYYLITHKIPYSSTALGRINKRILTDIRTLLFYSLSADDIFHRAKVINMLHILDWRIMALSRKDLVVKTAWLQNLMEKRQRYRKLLDIMQDCLDIPEEEQDRQDGDEIALLDALRNKVVATKLQHPNYNVSEISQISGISKPTFSRKLRQYMVAAYAYIH